MVVSVTVPCGKLVPQLGPLRDELGRATIVETAVLFYSQYRPHRRYKVKEKEKRSARCASQSETHQLESLALHQQNQTLHSYVIFPPFLGCLKKDQSGDSNNYAHLTHVTL